MVLKFNNSNQISDFPFFKKRLIEAIGIILCIFSFILTLSLFSFTPNDPSFSNLTDSKVQNLVGTHGAYASDALLNLFGVGSIMIILISIAFNQSVKISDVEKTALISSFIFIDIEYFAKRYIPDA